jgi:hypothetical protein
MLHSLTIRIPRRGLYVVLAVVVLAVAGVGGYFVGRDSRTGVVSHLSLLERRDAAAAVDESVHQRDTAQLLINLCREVVRLPVAFGSLDPASCNPGALVYLPTGPQTLVGHNSNLRQGIQGICNMVLHVEGARAFLDQRRAGCLEHIAPLPSEPVITLPGPK